MDYYKVDPNLERLTMINIVTNFWKIEMANYDGELPDQKVKNRISSLLLPATLKMELIGFVSDISETLDDFRIHLQEHISETGVLKSAPLVEYTAEGSIDYEESIDKIITDESVPIEDRYKLAKAEWSFGITDLLTKLNLEKIHLFAYTTNNTELLAAFRIEDESERLIKIYEEAILSYAEVFKFWEIEPILMALPEERWNLCLSNAMDRTHAAFLKLLQDEDIDPVKKRQMKDRHENTLSYLNESIDDIPIQYRNKKF